MEKRQVVLQDKYLLEKGRAIMTGIQALVRLPLVQRRLDQSRGWNSAGFISGYRGSPLGALDQQLVLNRELLEEHHVRFNPGVNEDLAATSVWGTQQAEIHSQGRYDGVFGLWYGKGPGIDRSGDALRHANLAGTSSRGGVLALMGDDHTCESSTTCHQSEFAMMDAMVPVFNPAGVQEILDFGLYGWALSRYSGCWVGLKCIHDTVESTATVDVSADRCNIILPEDYQIPPDGLNIRWPDSPHEQERRLHEYKLDAVRAFVRANRLNRVLMDSQNARIGILSTGKALLDTRLALDELSLGPQEAEVLGVRLMQVAMTWPLEPEGILEFSQGLKLIVVIEEKRGVIEPQLKELLYHTADAPQVIGKQDEQGALLFPSAGALDPNHIALTLSDRILERCTPKASSETSALSQLRDRVGKLRERIESSGKIEESLSRLPYFCAGCPHNSSTVVPEGSHAYAGIGCHYMAQWMDRSTAGFTQMGAEGANWVGESFFSKREHVFQNIGDGTYFHSGLLAIRSAIAANVNVTFKILFNDAVAMTGGQPMDGPLTVPRITQQVRAEGAGEVVVVTDDPNRYQGENRFASGVTVYERKQLDQVQRRLREISGVTVLVYEQTCAAEKRRRRKRGRFPDPPRRIFINEEVCEGCGDCGVKSNCVAVLPLETELGRKRVVDQSACNKDFSCANGLCPSFVSVMGGKPRKAKPISMGTLSFDELPEPELPQFEKNYNIVITGVGGTGVITIGALLGMASHIEKKGCGILDMIGLAQKGGAVLSHLRIAMDQQEIHSPRIAGGGADVIIGCDLVVSGGNKTLELVNAGHTQMIVNSHEMITGDFTRNADMAFPLLELKKAISETAGPNHVDFINSQRLATALIGDSIASNLFLLGYAFQSGMIPLEASSIEEAIRINAISVDQNLQAFLWGRRAAHDLEQVNRIAFPETTKISETKKTQSLDELIDDRCRKLEKYQDKVYAERYRKKVEQIRELETSKKPGATDLSFAVARYYFKLLAYKDEYEVARMHTSPEFSKRLENQFEGNYSLKIHLAPPLWSKRDPNSGEPIKSTYGAWIFGAMKILSRFKFLRGTAFDLFGYSEERRLERQLIREYEQLLEELLAGLQPENHSISIQLAELPEQIRGYDVVKKLHVRDAEKNRQELLDRFRGVLDNNKEKQPAEEALN